MAKSESTLDYLVRLDNDARDFGFEWSDTTQVIDWVISECLEVKEAIAHQESPERIQEEIGDLMYCAISLCLHSGFDVEQTLHATGEKFETRFNALRRIAL